MRCRVMNCVNNENGYCDCSSYVEIEEDGTCSEIRVSQHNEEKDIMADRECSDLYESVKDKLVYAGDVLDLFYTASIGQDKHFVDTVEDVIENAPGVDDRPKVVYCKDCKYRFAVNGKSYFCKLHRGLVGQVAESDYCSRGERNY